MHEEGEKMRKYSFSTIHQLALEEDCQSIIDETGSSDPWELIETLKKHYKQFYLLYYSTDCLLFALNLLLESEI